MSYLDLAGLLAILGFILATAMLLIYLERKVLGHIQMRLGPMRVGFHGALQSPADVVKLLVKEDLVPATADRWVFRLAPYVIFVPAFLIFVTLPFTADWAVRNFDLGLFYIVAITGLPPVGMVMAGWASNNKFALLGSVRAAAQMVSYELPLVITLLAVAMVAGSLNVREIVEQQAHLPFVLVQPLGFLLYFTAALAELGRTPFDVPAAESELIGGPSIEYSGLRWAFIYLSEYTMVFVNSALAALLFLGGWQGGLLPPIVWFLLKTYAMIMAVFWIRATFPRLRVDQLMAFAWKFMLPLAFVNLLLTGVYLLYGWAALGVCLAGAALVVFVLYRPWWRRL